jgi:hypothetical protein
VFRLVFPVPSGHQIACPGPSRGPRSSEPGPQRPELAGDRLGGRTPPLAPGWEAGRRTATDGRCLERIDHPERFGTEGRKPAHPPRTHRVKREPKRIGGDGLDVMTVSRARGWFWPSTAGASSACRAKELDRPLQSGRSQARRPAIKTAENALVHPIPAHFGCYVCSSAAAR